MMKSIKKSVQSLQLKTKPFENPKQTYLRYQQQMFDDMPANTLLVLLVMMEIIMLIFSLLGQFSSGVYFMGMRVIFLIIAQCCKRPSSAAFYSVLALMNAFYAFDPVGLFVTGHGDKRTLAANIFCILACALAFFTSYVGYLYKLALEKQNPDQEGGANPFNPSFLNNGNGVGYVNPNDNRNQYPYGGPGARDFQPFQGQGHYIS